MPYSVLPVVWRKVGILLGLAVLGSAWFAGFQLLGRRFAPAEQPAKSAGTREVMSHLLALAEVQRANFDLDRFYGARHEPHMLDAVVELVEPGPLPPNVITLDGFIAKHVDVYTGDDGIISVIAVFTRRPPYTWPRTLDVGTGAGYLERADLVTAYSSELTGYYRVNGESHFEMQSPHGLFTWAVTKNRDQITSPACIFRQDLYKQGEWIRSLIAVHK